MTIQFHIRGMQDDAALRQQLEADLDGLNRLVAVDLAHVMLQRQREVTPPYQAVAMLAVSGPDIHAAARDHTWLAAWQKVLTRLREQIAERQIHLAGRRMPPPRIPTPNR